MKRSGKAVTGWVTLMLLILILGLSPTLAHADEVTVAGTTAGDFGGGADTLDGLSYTGSSFNVTTEFGMAAIGSGPGDPNNLGSFTLTGDPADYDGETFTLAITFSVPTGIDSGNSATFTATLIGQVQSNANGGVTVDFGNQFQTFTFSNASGSGSFTVYVDSVSITPGQTASLTGFLEGQQAVPEPASIMLLGAGLLGLGVGSRRLRFGAKRGQQERP